VATQKEMERRSKRGQIGRAQGDPKKIDRVDPKDLLQADGVILGSPNYYREHGGRG